MNPIYPSVPLEGGLHQGRGASETWPRDLSNWASETAAFNSQPGAP